MTITLFRDHAPARNEKDISADIISGTPRQFAQLMYSGKDGALKSGIWESSAGAFRASYNGIVEFCHILEGSATITSSDGQTVTVTAGDAFVLDEGLETEWTVETFVKKHFFISAV